MSAESHRLALKSLQMVPSVNVWFLQALLLHLSFGALFSIMLCLPVVPHTGNMHHILQTTSQLSPQFCHIFACKVALPLDILHILSEVIHNRKMIKQKKSLRKSIIHF